MSIYLLKPSYRDYIWGGTNLIQKYGKHYKGDRLAESWELSCHPSGMSSISYNNVEISLSDYISINGKSVLGTNCIKYNRFPLIAKLIDANDALSIQVHPDDEYALKNEGEYGKTEAWYVVDCMDNSFLYYGFSKELTKDEFKMKIKDNTLTDALNKVYVKKGDVLLVEPGTIHSIGKGIIIAEIQENSNITYRVYDYGRVDKNGKPRRLDIEKAIDVTHFCIPALKPSSSHLLECRYFNIDKLSLNNSVGSDTSLTATEKTFICIMVLDGSGIIYDKDCSLSYHKGDSFFIPACDGKFQLSGTGTMLSITVN